MSCYIRSFVNGLIDSIDITFEANEEDVTYLFEESRSAWNSFADEWREEICGSVATIAYCDIRDAIEKHKSLS